MNTCQLATLSWSVSCVRTYFIKAILSLAAPFLDYIVPDEVRCGEECGRSVWPAVQHPQRMCRTICGTHPYFHSKLVSCDPEVSWQACWLVVGAKLCFRSPRLTLSRRDLDSHWHVSLSNPAVHRQRSPPTVPQLAGACRMHQRAMRLSFPATSAALQSQPLPHCNDRNSRVCGSFLFSAVAGLMLQLSEPRRWAACTFPAPS